MKFALLMALRDTRETWRKLMGYSLSIVLGVATLYAVHALSLGLKGAIEAQFKGILGADMTLALRGAPSPELEHYLGTIASNSSIYHDFDSMMVNLANPGKARFVTVRAIEGDFPFYGELATDPKGAMQEVQRNAGRVLLPKDLMEAMGLKVGDRVSVGDGIFVIGGAVVRSTADLSRVFDARPMAIINLRAAASIWEGYAHPHSRPHVLAIQLRPGIRDLDIAKVVSSTFAKEVTNCTTATAARAFFEGLIGDLDCFFGLVGFVGVLLGAVGLTFALQVHLREKAAIVGVLRCVGASSWKALLPWGLQAVGICVIGSIAGAAIGMLLDFATRQYLDRLMPLPWSASVAWSALPEAVIPAVVVSFLLCSMPLLAMRRSPPTRDAFAETVGSGRTGEYALNIIMGVAVCTCILGYAFWETRHEPAAERSWDAWLYLIVLGTGFGTLALGAQALSVIARRLARHVRSSSLRLGVINLGRPGNRTALMLVSLGLSTFLTSVVAVACSSLLNLFQVPPLGGGANIVLYGVGAKQLEPVLAAVTRQGAWVVDRAPVLNIALSSINGKPAERVLADRGDPQASALLAERTQATIRDRWSLDAGSAEGPAMESSTGRDVSETPVAISDTLNRKGAGIRLGDSAVWIVGGVPVHSRVIKVYSTRMRMLTYADVIFPPGPIDAAPRGYIVGVRASTLQGRTTIVSKVPMEFRGVTAFDVNDFVRATDGVYTKLSAGVEVICIPLVATAIGLVGAVFWGGRQYRMATMQVLRRLGASRAQLLSIHLTEYTAIGILGGAIGIVTALVVSVIAEPMLFKIPVHIPWLLPPASLVGSALITLAAGCLTAPLTLGRSEVVSSGTTAG